MERKVSGWRCIEDFKRSQLEPEGDEEETMVTETAKRDITTRDVTWVPLEQLDDNPWQPRSSYPQKDIAELAESIHQVGLRQYPEGRIAGQRVQLAYGHLRKRAYEKLARTVGSP
jgi:hypothetical protein